MSARIARVFPRRTSATPDDELAFIGEPGLFVPDVDEVHVSCTFTWDKPEAERIADSWSHVCKNTKLGGPAYDDPGSGFTPGMYIKKGFVITSRGCPNRCRFCFVGRREGGLRTLPIVDGHNVLDNNLLACPDDHIDAVFAMLRRQRKAACFTGGFESSRITDDLIGRLHGMRIGHLHMAYDRPSQAEPLVQACKKLYNAGFTMGQIRCYVLVGYAGDTPEAAESRLRFVFENGACPFAMYYLPTDATSRKRRSIEWVKLMCAWTPQRVVFARMKRLGIMPRKQTETTYEPVV